MATAEQRYRAATHYIERAMLDVERGPLWSYLNPLMGLADVIAGGYKTETARNELDRIEAGWLRAVSDVERSRIAREAELLADRVQENLPGAPQDRQRTNLTIDEKQKATPATSYFGEVWNQSAEVKRVAHDAWNWLERKADQAADAAQGVGKWLLIGGGLLLGIQGFRLLRERERRRNLRRLPTKRTINTRLEEIAEATSPKYVRRTRAKTTLELKPSHRERRR